ncbi:BadF/BadG/BcrA/BcrD ATPase family protein [Xanthobacteraceae bacterium Astr-EGSB]|uniref:BadF/BadG/BcrA/BcrD ATPase family protein n=1 Tax=Astrobacterium formosum TaxID=3069710 RepID=UPI0027B34426|nr:BadF/BadG/BcrA/BcrD ATPase family protein [Xanthobacteraceae bacterium Astr-EGSB]
MTTPGDLFLGVDGGGTGCRARVVDRQGRVLGYGVAGPATLRLGIERASAEVQRASRSALADAGLDSDELGVVHAAVGLAGVGRTCVLADLSTQPHPFRSVVYAHDAAIACLGAHGGRDGGIVILGTGSIGFGFVGGREIRIGGYGFPISDEGSGADLGLAAIRLTLRAHDQRAIGSRLTHDVMAHFQNDPFDAVTWMEQATATDYATFAPLIMRHADAGDTVARAIVRDAAEQIDALVRRLIECGAPRVALLGGLASPMCPWLAPDVQHSLVAAEGDAVDGALLLARGSAG